MAKKKWIGWLYGLVQDGKRLVLAEIYAIQSDTPNAYCELTFKDLKKRDVVVMLQDLLGQFKTKTFFVVDPKTNRLRVRKRP